MGISMGKGKGSMAEPNVVPLIDILLVLIIIFMVVTPLTPKGLEALIPQPPPPDSEPDQDVLARTVVIQVLCLDPTCLRPGVKVNDQDLTWETLGPRLQEIFKTRAEKVAFVKGDDNLEFSHVARAIDIAKGSGVEKVGLMTAKVGE